MSTSKLRRLRIIAMVMLVSIINQIAFPTVALALTSYATQPDIVGYTPVDATDNVNLSSGGFNYTLPITSIPEFPMAISYNAGLGMEHEASAFGFGFNGFSGAISRTVNGLPDDLNGAVRKITFQNEKNTDFSFSSGATLGYSAGGMVLGARAGYTVGYNNYTGAYGAVSIGVAAGAGIGSTVNGGAGLGAQIMADSRSKTPTFAAGAGIGLGLSAKTDKGNIGTSTGMGAGLYAARPINGGQDWNTGGNVGLQSFSGKSKNSAGESVKTISSMAPLAYVVPNQITKSNSINVSFPVYAVTLDISVAWSKTYWNESPVNKYGYGFMYLNGYNRTNVENIADMTIEGEDSFNGSEYNSPVYLQKDNYSINTMGVGGGVEIYQPTYGVVSRNQSSNTEINRKLLVQKVNTKEVEPWTATVQNSMNKSADILAIIKNPENLLDEIFKKDTRVDLNTEKQRFTSDAVFKMRGDFAGEYNLASTSYTDHEVSSFTAEPVQGISSSKKVFVLGIETKQPLKYPVETRNYKSYADNNKIERGTNIIKHTIGEILDAADRSSKFQDQDPNVLTAAAKFDFKQNFYSHYYYNSAGVAKASNYTLTPTATKVLSMNTLNKLSILRSQTADKNAINSLVGSIEVQKENGLRYFFNLPVFNKTTKGVGLMGKGKNAPEDNGADYHSYSRDGQFFERQKTITEEDYVYPYAWLLTAIVGDDYIDFDNIPGPSDGDIGYWVKFKYIKTADEYRWRKPFTGLDHEPGKIHLQDDNYSVITGTKEIYNLFEIESSNYVCKYQYQKRFDGVDAAGYFNGKAQNSLTNKPAVSVTDPTGNNFQFAVTQVDLYKKHADGDNSAVVSQTPKVIKSTRFYYDYSTSSNVPNNYNKYLATTIKKSALSYLDPLQTGYVANASIGTGKLTLRKVQHIAYDATGAIASATYLPSYEFNYYGDDNGVYNPAYDANCWDSWGNYMKNAKNTYSGENGTVNYYNHYTEYIKAEADENAKVFKLKSINLPSGGTMNVDYQAQSYSLVENKTPYVMRRVYSTEKSGDYTIVKVDITDIDATLFSNGLISATVSGQPGIGAKILNVNDRIYGEIAYYRNTAISNTNGYKDPANTIIIPEEAYVQSVSATITTQGGRRYQDVVLRSVNEDDNKTNPFINQCEREMYYNSAEAQAMADAMSTDCNSINNYVADLESKSRTDFGESFMKVISHIGKMFKPKADQKTNFNTCFGAPAGLPPTDPNPLYSHWSFLRTPIYKAKYTGAVVKSIILSDNFGYATSDLNPALVKDNPNIYGTNYYYDVLGNGTGASAGVATNEPGGGKACVINNYARTGAGYSIAPNITCSQVALENLYQVDDAGKVAGDKISRKKGKTVYKFYTANDQGMHFSENFKAKLDYADAKPVKGNFFMFGFISFFKIKLLIWPFKKKQYLNLRLPKFNYIVLNWHLEDHYALKSYAFTDNSDMIGKLKTIHQYDANGQEMGTQEYNYFGMDEAVPTFKNNFNSSVINKPGKVDQVWSEAFYTREDNIQKYPARVVIANTKKHFSHTTMKYSYIPSVLKEVVSTIDGLTTKTSYTGFDYYTGTPIQTESFDSYNNKKISRTVPAYWMYPEMGPSSVNSNYINNMTATTENYMYLNSVSNSNLIGAGVVKWESGKSGKWDFINYVQPLQKYNSSTSMKYYYTDYAGSTIRTSYSSAEKVKEFIPKISRNASIYKPYKGYTYEVPLTTDGTFTSFVAFNHQPGANNDTWKELSTNELYSANGVLVQSKDVLGKYAAQLLGYNFSNTIGAVSNSSWAACAYEGAENTYSNSAGTVVMLENNKVQLKNAIAVKACQDQTFTTKTFSCTDATLANALHKLSITIPNTFNYGVPFAKVRVNYSNNTKLFRDLYISYNLNNEIMIMSNKGEVFDGFLTYPTAVNKLDLYFKNADFVASTGFVLDNSYTSADGFLVTYQANQTLPGPCTCTTKTYYVPTADCGIYAHTGNYAFLLDAGNKIGTEFILHTDKTKAGFLNATEFKRQYKALVWVHNSSPLNTELVVQLTNSYLSTGTVAAEYKTSLATPHVKAGDWSLLRLDFDLTNQAMTGVYAHVFVRNATDAAQLWPSNYDDLRVLPYHADMTNWVFEHQFNRVTSGLDVDNFASYSAYDNRGRVTESLIEIQNEGKKSVQKFMYNDQKKQ